MSIPKLDQVLKLEQIKWAIKQGKLRPKDENIDNHGYIGDISADILEKNIDKHKIVKNS